jgi:hypothetical protein
MTTATLQPPSADTYITSTDPLENFDTSTLLAVGEASGGDVRYYVSLLKFTLSSIPANAVVSAATLSVYDPSSGDDGAQTMYCHRILKDWVSASTTWIKYNAADDWGGAGAADATDRSGAALGSVVMSNQAAGYEWQISLDTAVVQAMIAGTYPNYGFGLYVALTDTNKYHDLYSAEYATDTAKRPKLVIEYTAGSGGGGGFFF